MTEYYVHYKGKTMDPCSLDRGIYENAKATWLCTGCSSPKPGVKRLDVRIQEERPDGPLNIVNGCGIALARRAFLSRFGKLRIEEYLDLGDVHGPDGQLIPEWATFVGKHRLIVRGSKNAGHRKCPECGRNIYFGMGKTYLFPKPMQGVELFESDLWGLIVPEHIAETLGISESDGVWIERLPVLDEPLDGLPPLVP